MVQQMDEPPDPAIWNRTIPYSLRGDEGTLPNSASWMFGTLCLTITPAYSALAAQFSKVNLIGALPLGFSVEGLLPSFGSAAEDV